MLRMHSDATPENATVKQKNRDMNFIAAYIFTASSC
jgi:hypothetical protein